MAEYMPHELHVEVAGVAENETFQLCQIAETAADARQLAGLLQGDNIPLLVADDRLQSGLIAHSLNTSHHLAVDVGGLFVDEVVVVCVYGTATDVGIANDERVALGGSEFVEVLFYSIL